MDNKVINIDFGNYTEEELDLIVQKAEESKKKSLDRRVAELENYCKQNDAKIKLLISEKDELSSKLDVSEKELKIIKDTIGVLGFEDDGTLGRLKKTAQSRVYKLLGGSGTPQSSILFRTCITNLYGSITNSLCGGKKLERIKVDDGSVAITLASRYVLNRACIHKKIESLQKEQEKGILTPEKSKALDLTIEWLESRGM